MIRWGTWETKEEIQITYSREQRILYHQKDPRCIYDQFPRQVGINKSNFVEMVAKKYLRDKGIMLKSITTLSEIREARKHARLQKIAISSAKEKFAS